jgi:hypothetical protein
MYKHKYFKYLCKCKKQLGGGEKISCGICMKNGDELDDDNSFVRLECGHYFCTNCLRNYSGGVYSNYRKCPACNNHLNIRHNIYLSREEFPELYKEHETLIDEETITEKLLSMGKYVHKYDEIQNQINKKQIKIDEIRKNINEIDKNIYEKNHDLDELFQQQQQQNNEEIQIRIQELLYTIGSMEREKNEMEQQIYQLQN